jgi:signal transduction histidine kinase
VDAVVSVAASMVTHQANEKGIDLDRHSCSPALTASGDRQKVVQILINLLSNAIKFTPRGGRIELRCGTSQAGDAEATVWMAVRDTGLGIPADQLQRIFEPFVQVDRNQRSGTEGVGLGLAISRRFARAMRGEVSVQSEEGAGAEFTLVLPYRPPRASTPVESHADERREIKHSC